MRVKLRTRGSFASYYCSLNEVYEPVEAGFGIYSFSTRSGPFRLTKAQLEQHFEVVEEPQPAILRGRVETQEEIENRLGCKSDPFGAGIKEIMGYQKTLHTLTGDRAASIEVFRLLIPMIDNLSTDLWDKSLADNRFRIGEIKKLILGGAKG